MSTYYAKDKYLGQAASRYNRTRCEGTLNRLRWQSEMRAVQGVLQSLATAQRLLDVPCGTGRFLPLFLGAQHEVVGLDISADMLSQVPDEWRCERLSLEQGDAQHLPFEDQSFDYVFSMRLFNHLPGEVRIEVLKELRRVARQAVAIEIRFAGRWESPDVRWADAAKDMVKIGWWWARSIGRGAGPKDHRPILRRRVARPRLEEFRSLSASLGLRLSACHSIFWGFTLSPMKLCVLQPH